MALKIKAKEKKLKFSKDGPEVYRYVMVPDLYSTLDSEKVIKEAAIRSGVSEGVMQACWKGAGEVIKAWATEWPSVAQALITSPAPFQQACITPSLTPERMAASLMTLS